MWRDGPTIADAKAAERRERAALIGTTREQVFNRANGKCECCRRRIARHLHELEYRSSGIPWRELFLPAFCVALCRECHRDIHGDVGHPPCVEAVWDGDRPDASTPGGVRFRKRMSRWPVR